MRASERSAIAVVLVAAAALLLVGLGDAPLRPYDEGLYARLARNALAHGEWLHAVDADGSFSEDFSKPPLSLWLTALSFRVFGVSMAALRLPFALGMLAVVVIAVAFGTRARGPAHGALWGAAITLGAAALRWGRFACIEPLFVAFVLLSLWAHTEALAARGARSDRWALACGAALSLGFLTKQLAIGIAVLPILVTEAVLWRRAGVGRVRRLAIALGVGGLVGGAWLVGAARRVGSPLFETFFSASVARRIGGFASGHNARTLNELAGIVDEAMLPLPWVLGAAGLVFALWRPRGETTAGAADDRRAAAAISIAALAVGAALLYDNVAHTLLPWYAFAFVPALAFGLAEIFEAAIDLVRKPDPARVAAGAAGLFALAWAIVAAARPWVSQLDVAIALGALALVLARRCGRATPTGPLVAGGLALVGVSTLRAPELRSEPSGLGVLMEELHRRGIERVDVHVDTGATTQTEYAAYFGPKAKSVRTPPWRRRSPDAEAFVTAAVPPRELAEVHDTELLRAPGVVAWIGDLSRPPHDEATTRALLEAGPITFEAEDLGTDLPGSLVDDDAASGGQARARDAATAERWGDGALTRGPGWVLPAGAYEATFFVRAQCPAPEASTGWIGVYADRRERAREPLPCEPAAGESFSPVTVGFRLLRSSRVELRVAHVRGALAHDRTLVRRLGS